MIDPETQPLLTTEQETELERLRLERITRETELAETQKQIAAQKAEHRDRVFRHNLHEAVKATGLKPLSIIDPDDLVQFVQIGLRLEVNEDGTFTAHDERGRVLEFEKAFRTFAIQRPHLFDGRTTKRLQDDNALYRSEMTIAEKAAYIAKSGLNNFQRLPMHRPAPKVSLDRMTATDWQRLTPKQKAGIVEAHGSEIVSEILKRRK